MPEEASLVDFVLGLALAAMLVRGWSRGFVRESLDLVSLVFGLWVAFRLSAPVGDFLADTFGVSPEVARIGGGIALFVIFGAGLSVAAHYLSKVMNLPGLSMVNRVGGAGVAVAWGIAIVFVLVSVVQALPIPETWRSELDDSNVVNAITGDDAVPRGLFESLAGDNVMAAISSIRDLFGQSRAVPEGDETLEIPQAPPDEVRQDRDEADRVLKELNEYRVSQGVKAVQPVGPMTDMAEDFASKFYASGTLSRLGECRLTLANAGYDVLRCDSGVALAGTALGAFDGILDASYGPGTLGDPDMDRAGIAVADGPTGRLLVVMLGG